MSSDALVSNQPKWKVLIIDDDTCMVHALQRLLTLRKYYEVKALYDGTGINQKIDEWLPHLIIIDVKMRGIDGFEVCGSIRNCPEKDHIKIIAISGTVDEEDMKRMLEIGANAYFEKPFQNDALMAEIERQLGVC